jgi:hypothetical protein
VQKGRLDRGFHFGSSLFLEENLEKEGRSNAMAAIVRGVMSKKMPGAR